MHKMYKIYNNFMQDITGYIYNEADELLQSRD